MKYGNRFLDSNAHRCLLLVKQDLRLAWQNLRAAFRWQFSRHKFRPKAPKKGCYCNVIPCHHTRP